MPLDWFSIYAPFYDRFVTLARISPVADLLALAALQGHERLLDVGGGTGRIAAAAASQAHEVVILERCRAMLKRSPEHPRLRRVRGCALKLPFPDASFDVLLCVDALHHIKDAEGSIVEMARVLKPGGRVIVQEFDVRGWRGRGAAILERVFVDRSRFLAPARLSALFGREGIHGGTQAHSWLEYTFLGRKAGVVEHEGGAEGAKRPGGPPSFMSAR